jgi:thiamine kinase-like enzyme
MRSLFNLKKTPGDDTLCLTLITGWADRYGYDFAISCDGPGQRWRLHLPTGAYYSGRPTQQIRKWLADQCRYTPFPVRAIPQYILGTASASRAGLQYFSSPEFVIDPPIPEADTKLVLPGGRRVRVFDYSSGLCRVHLRHGGNKKIMEREIKLRAEAKQGPFVNILTYDQNAEWFEEPIFDGFNLARLPLRFNRTKLYRQACELLSQWQKPDKRKENVADYVDNLCSDIQRSLKEARLPPKVSFENSLEKIVRELAQTTGELTAIFTAPGHGDFQPGNIMVSRDGKQVVFVDWEFTARRWEHYDLFVLALGSRWAGQAARATERYLKNSAAVALLAHLGFDKRNRHAALSLFFLEDLRWYLHESSISGDGAPSPGLLNFLDQLNILFQRGDLDRSAR